jgi:hypothetical protein
VSEPSPLSEAAEGYVQLFRSWLATADEQITSIANRIDAGTFDAATAADVLGRMFSLSMKGWVDVLLEGLDAAAVITNPPVTRRPITSDPVPTGDTNQTRVVKVRQDFLSGFGHTIRAHRIEVLPSATLAPGTADFRLTTTVRQEPSGFYRGQVEVQVVGRGAEAKPEPITVELLVP